MEKHRYRQLAILQPAVRCFMLGLLIGGCGVSNSPTLSNRVVGSDGQIFTLDEIRETANNQTLSEEEKRNEFRTWGIEDEKIIDVLLQL